MLKKEICMRCNDEFFIRAKWSSMDEARWEKGYITCPHAFKGPAPLFNRKTEDIDKACKYKLEHLVLNEQSK